MRLWHKELIPVLPRQQLLAQWRECCCIARNIAVNGTPNHILVNKVLQYPCSHFEDYCKLVTKEMERRGYNVSESALMDLNLSLSTARLMGAFADKCSTEVIFGDWHTNRYMWQCYFNLQEKYDCGGIPKEEWMLIEDVAMGVLYMGGRQ